MSRLCVGWVAVLFLASPSLSPAQTASGAFKAQPEGSITPPSGWLFDSAAMAGMLQ